MLSLLGIIGGILFLIAPLPAAVRAIRTKKTSIPVDVSLVICIGTVVQYVFLLLSYGFSTVCL
jgi:uncharacterized protein with PQ loop repeat